jgi:hypothetical protein
MVVASALIVGACVWWRTDRAADLRSAVDANVAAKIRFAQQALIDRQDVDPTGASAVDYYPAVLELDPRNQHAKAGLVRARIESWRTTPPHPAWQAGGCGGRDRERAAQAGYVEVANQAWAAAHSLGFNSADLESADSTVRTALPQPRGTHHRCQRGELVRQGGDRRRAQVAL